MKKKILKITLSVVLILILAVGIGLAYLVGAAGGGGPFDFVWKNNLYYENHLLPGTDVLFTFHCHGNFDYIWFLYEKRDFHRGIHKAG